MKIVNLAILKGQFVIAKTIKHKTLSDPDFVFYNLTLLEALILVILFLECTIRSS